MAAGSETDDRYYVFGNYIDEVLVMNDGTDDHYYGHDHLFSAVVLFDSTGTAVERYEYDAYGKAAIWDASLTTPRTISTFGNPYTFTGRRLDVFDSGDYEIMYYRNRYYSTHTGRFITQDPLGINPAGGKQNLFEIQKQYTDGMSLYEYVKSNPVLFLDPKGTNIYLMAGNDSWNPFNNAVHQSVCVDNWEYIGGRIKWITNGKYCFSFAMILRMGLALPKRTWLGFKVTNFGGCGKGMIYLDDYTDGDIVHWKLTTREQDSQWLMYMFDRVDTEDVYILGRLDCRRYSQLEFDAAPGVLDVDAITGRITGL